MTLISSSAHRAPRNRAFLKTLRHHLAVWQQRRALRQLDDTRLQDLGLTRAEAEAEAKRPFWDAPETWRI